jgi:hypothetical protein
VRRDVVDFGSGLTATIPAWRHLMKKNVLTVDGLRQGSIEHVVRYVLAVSMGLAIVALIVAYAFS